MYTYYCCLMTIHVTKACFIRIKRPVVVKGAVTQLAVLSRYRVGEDEEDEMEESLVTDPFNEEDNKSVNLDGEGIKKRMSRLLETATNQTLTVDDLKSLLVSCKFMLERSVVLFD